MSNLNNEENKRSDNNEHNKNKNNNSDARNGDITSPQNTNNN